MSNNKKKVLEQVEYLDSVVSLIPGHIYWKDLDGNYLGCNNNQAKALGLKSRYDIVKLKPYQKLSLKEAKKLIAIDNEVIRSKKTITKEEPGIRDNGETGIFLTKKTPLLNKRKHMIGILGISFDITDLKEAEKRERKAITEKIKASKDKDILQKQIESLYLASNTIAHELRTPLCDINAAALLSIMILEKTKNQIPNKAFNSLIEYINNIKEFTSQTQKLIDIILENAKDIENTPLEILNVVPVIKSATQEFPYKNEDEITKINYESEEDFQINGDPHLLKHLIWNLMKNSLYFIEEQGKGEIFIWSTEDKNYYYLHFKDTAKGVSEEIKESMFKPYYTKTGIGTGIGLNFCNRVMKTFRGSIKCESKEGEYTEFIMKFPKIK